MDEQKKPILTLEYTIQPEEYLHFNQYFAKENFQAKKNKTTLVGAIETVVALILLHATATGEGQYRLMLILLSAALVACGLYSMLFYTVIFPWSLKNAARKNYEKSDYLKNPIRQDFYPDSLVETSQGVENRFYWNEVSEIRETPILFMLILEEKRTILIPKSGLGDQIYELDECLKLIEQKYGKQRIVSQ